MTMKKRIVAATMAAVAMLTVTMGMALASPAGGDQGCQ